MVTRAEGCLRLEDGTLAGSVLTMDEAVRYCAGTVGLDLADTLAMAALVPAAFLRRDHELGRVAPGYLANLVHLSDDLHVRETWIEGR
jgi:N-acetylglucosamine-6-phosphate deacetylase